MTVTKLLSLTGKVALSLLLAVIVGALAVLTVVPRAVHGSALTVLTGSMTPTIPVGSVVVVQPVDAGTLHVGDVITYQRTPGKPDYVTHRITAIHTGTTPVTLTTKGDANRGEDVSPVPVTAVRGRVLFHVPYLGTLRNAVSGGAIALPLAVLGLIAYAASQLLAARRDKKAAGATSRPQPLVAPAPPEPVGLSVQLLVVTLRLAEFEGMSAQRVADLLRTDLLEEGSSTFTVAMNAAPDKVAELAEALRPFHPVAVRRSDVVHVPSCSTPPAIDLRTPAARQVPHAVA
jgi:signal peptidase